MKEVTSIVQNNNNSHRAVVDIGSNAIRASIYRNNRIGSPEIYNVGFKLNIKYFVNQYSKENDNSKSHDNINIEKNNINYSFSLVLKHLKDIFNNFNVSKVTYVATAAMRLIENYQELLDYIKKEYDIDIQVITGEQEAIFAAKAIIASIPDASGVIADLGGGSLELSSIANGIIKDICSLYTYNKDQEINYKELRTNIANTIKAKIKINNCKVLYLVGGAFKLIAKEYAHIIDYPFANLHALSLHTEYLKDQLLKDIIHNSDASKRSLKARYGAMILQELLYILSPNEVIISNYGLKEGVHIHESENNDVDIVLEGCRQITQINCDSETIESYYAIFVSVLGKTLDKDDESYLKKVLECSIMFSSVDLGVVSYSYAHIIKEIILSANIPLLPRDRVMIMIAVFIGNNKNVDYHLSNISKRIISTKDYLYTSIFGKIISIGKQIGGSLLSKPKFSIELATAHKLYIKEQSGRRMPNNVFISIQSSLKSIYLYKIKLLNLN